MRTGSSGRRTTALAMAAVLGAALAAPAHAEDVVRLKSGRELRGKVDDRGSHVIITCEGSGGAKAVLRLERSEIQAIELDGQTVTSKDADVVVLLSGDEVAGRVELRQSGRRIAVVQKNGGEVLFDQRQVRTILWSAEAQSVLRGPDGGGVGRTVETLLAEIASGEAERTQIALAQLLDLGVFALPYLEARNAREGDPPHVKLALQRALAVAHTRSYLSSFLIEKLPDLAKRLEDSNPEVRLEALKQAVLISPKETPPVLLHLAKREKVPAVRGFVLGQLQLMGRSEELAELLQSEDRSLKFAAALALGDNGMYIGMEYVIDGLAHPAVEVRKVSIAALERWTGQFLGYFAEGDDEKAVAGRAQAVERWRAWFKEHGEEIIERSYRATVERYKVTDEEKDEARVYWAKAQALRTQLQQEGLEGEARIDEVLKIKLYLEKAIEKFPHFLNARLAIAELLLTELRLPAEARRHLDVVLHRYAEDAEVGSRVEAYLLLGQVAQHERKWIEAERHLRMAASLKPQDYRLHRALGKLCYQRGIEELAAEAPVEAPKDGTDRLAQLRASVTSFDEALKSLATLAERLAAAPTGNGAPVDEELPFAESAGLAQGDELKSQIARQQAELHFLRARSYSALHQDAKAYEDYVAAQKLQPQNAQYLGAVKVWEAKPQATPPAGTKPQTTPPAGTKPQTTPPAGTKPQTPPPAGTKPQTPPAAAKPQTPPASGTKPQTPPAAAKPQAPPASGAKPQTPPATGSKPQTPPAAAKPQTPPASGTKPQTPPATSPPPKEAPPSEKPKEAPPTGEGASGGSSAS